MAERRLRFLIEGTGAWLLLGFFGLLPLGWASALGGFLARNIGPHLGISNLARDNLRRAVAAEGLRKVDDFIDRHDTAVVEWPIDAIDPFFNINTPDDLAEAEQHLRALADKR